ncbi:MAG: hypothetical protein O7G30_11660 [Proteobacteria bacterium]|nr:hypothetical protein [Pseudomonadota bacterium]
MTTDPGDDRDRDSLAAAAHYREILKPVFRDEKMLLIGGPIVGLAGLAFQMGKLSGQRPFLLGSFRGTGPLPEPDLADWFSLDIRSPSIMDEFRSYEGALRNLPPEARAAIEAWDPDGRARAAGLIVLSEVAEVAGRRAYGRRRAEWLTFEDKLAAEALWRELDVAHAPSEIVPAEPQALRAAAGRLDRGQGSVWAGDAREGIHGGAEGTRWVRTDAEMDAAGAFFAGQCDRVRVMPFLEGIPCSIHGIVFPDTVVAFRPVELVTLRSASEGLLYAGLGTFWDPLDADREAMRALARRVGAAMRERAGFVGAFTIDGVVAEEGFLPTEINSRFGAGLGSIGAALPTLPLAALTLAVAEGETLDYRPEWLEEVMVREADRHRSGQGARVLHQPREETVTRELVGDGDGFRFANDEEEGDASLILGPAAAGAFLRISPRPERMPRGGSLAPFVVKAFAFADRALGTGLGPLEAARDVRT